jgi:drug/metabolite transporter (DMT)-like permease
MASCAQSNRYGWLTVGWFVLFAVLSTASGVCFKQSGTDVAHRVPYFVTAAALGWLCMGITMVLYRRLNVNLVSAVNAGFGAIALNLTLWWLFKTDLTPLQWAGIVAAAGGTMLALLGGPAADAEGAATAATGEVG